MRYALTVMVLLAWVPLACEEKAKPKKAGSMPPNTRTMARLPDPDRVAPRPTPKAKAKPVVKPLPTPPDEPKDAERVYIVQKGDTLWSIAKRELGDGKRWQEIAKLNGVTDPGGLKVGQQLKLPAK